MFNFGFSELMIIGALALIFIGPKQLPVVARTVGRLLNELKSATGDLTSSFVNMRDQANDSLRETQQKITHDLGASPSAGSAETALSKDGEAGVGVAENTNQSSVDPSGEKKDG